MNKADKYSMHADRCYIQRNKSCHLVTSKHTKRLKAYLRDN